MLISYNDANKVLLAVDCIIFGFDHQGLKILLVRRHFPPNKGTWSLIGGFLKLDETLDEAAIRLLHIYTGLNDIYMEQIYANSGVNRDPRGRIISVSYYALINIENHSEELIKNYQAEWFRIADTPDTVFDHGEMIKYAIKRLRY